MDHRTAATLAGLVLGAHLIVIGFNVFGLIAIPLGAWRGWRFVRVRWWRALHVASFAVVALQAALGRACFLTLWQDELAGRGGSQPLIMGWIDHVIFWPLPMWVFSAGYILLFIYVIALWKLVPPAASARARVGR